VDHLGKWAFLEDKYVQGVLRKNVMDQAGVLLQNVWYRTETDLDRKFSIQQLII
jgi:hypothetical protein